MKGSASSSVAATPAAIGTLRIYIYICVCVCVCVAVGVHRWVSGTVLHIIRSISVSQFEFIRSIFATLHLHLGSYILANTRHKCRLHLDAEASGGGGHFDGRGSMISSYMHMQSSVAWLVGCACICNRTQTCTGLSSFPTSPTTSQRSMCGPSSAGRRPPGLRGATTARWSVHTNT